jgi:hypothetical protein
MSLSTTPDGQVRCTRCATLNRPGARFCGGCGAAVALPAVPVPQADVQSAPPLLPPSPPRAPATTVQPAMPWVPPRPRPTGRPGQDGAASASPLTRYLCTGAQLDPGFADAAIAENLLEPTRPVPRSPGVDSAAVLRECVAARRRRKVRDAAVLLLFVLFVIAAPAFAVVWLGVALACKGWRGDTRRQAIIAVVMAAVLLLIAAVVVLGGTDWLALLPQPLGVGGTVLAVVVGLCLVAVVVVDEFLVTTLVRQRFALHMFQPDPSRLPPGWERTLRTLGLDRWAGPLARVVEAESRGGTPADRAPVTVHRVKTPFIGNGPVFRDESMALPLKPRSDDEDEDGEEDTPDQEPVPFTATELQAHIAHALCGLRNSGRLSPGHRLAGLTCSEELFVSARGLFRSGRPQFPSILADLRAAPAEFIPVAAARQLIEHSEELLRYYQCFRVEAWDSEVTTSLFFSAGTDQKMLYLEWVHCVLYPVKDAYRWIDRPDPAGPVLRGLLHAAALPASLSARLQTVLHRFHRLPWREGEFLPDRYGSWATLRELGSERITQYYFQDLDVHRYVQVVEQTLFRAVSDFLVERGYSVVDVLDVAKAGISNSITIKGGDFSNAAIGIGRTSQGNGGARRRDEKSKKVGKS